MLSYLTTVFIIFLKELCQSESTIGKNVTVYDVIAFNTRERSLLYYLHVKNDMVMFLNGVTNEAAVPMIVIVDSCCTGVFEEKLDNNDIEYFKDDLSKKLIKNHSDLAIKKSLRGSQSRVSQSFLGWKALYSWVESRCQKHVFMQKIVIGLTSEGRELFVVRISLGRKKMAIFLMGGEEGRDWLSISILLNFIHYFSIKSFNLDVLINQYDIYILPCLNPDGYAFSTEYFRFWPKNKKVYVTKRVCSNNSSAVGIYLSRNWYLGQFSYSGDQECDPLYAGPKSLSEEETMALSKFLDKIALRMLVFINVRSFQNLITIPYGYTTNLCNNYPVLMDIIQCVLETLHEEHHNISYQYGTTAQFYYNFSGNVADWVKAKLNTPVVYTLHMKQPDYILPSVEDIPLHTNRLVTIVREILMLADSIYNPLFSNSNTIVTSVLNTIMLSVILILL